MRCFDILLAKIYHDILDHMADDQLLIKITQILESRFAEVQQSIADVKTELQGSIDRVSEQLGPIKTEMQGMQTELQDHGKSLKYLKKKVNRMDKTLDIVVGRYDERIVKNANDIRDIQFRLGMTKN
jgi:chromosome segregation ATPase